MIITVFNPKGGATKSFYVSALPHHLPGRTLVIDFDGQATATGYYGATDAKINIADFLKNGHSVPIYKTKFENIDILPCDANLWAVQPNKKAQDNFNRLGSLPGYDYIFIDTIGSIHPITNLLFNSKIFHLIISPVTPNGEVIKEVKKFKKALMALAPIHIAPNMFGIFRETWDPDYKKYWQEIKNLGLPVLPKIHLRAQFQKAIEKGQVINHREIVAVAQEIIKIKKIMESSYVREKKTS